MTIISTRRSFPGTKMRHSPPCASMRRLQVEALESRHLLTAIPHLLKDIGGGDASEPFGLVDVSGTLYFGANDGTHGFALWKSDGTSAGTVLVKHIDPGAPSPYLKYMTNVGGTLFFRANDGANGFELWKSDGTSAGTVLVKDIRPGAWGSYLKNMMNVGGTLFFTANDGTHGDELWKSDGTSAGTVLVKDIRPGAGGGNLKYVANVNGTLFFRANDGINGIELWRSDGTSAGTVLVKDIGPGTASSSPYYLTNVGGTLFFAANGGTHGRELWRSDGTSAGTVLVKDIYPGATSPSLKYLTDVSGTLFFRANDGTSGIELWKSDGTSAGTVLVKDIRPGALGSSINELTNVGGTLFFRASDDVNGPEVWKSDGTSAGTVLVKDTYPGSETSFNGFPRFFTNVSGTLFFRTNDGTHGNELWKSDGTSAGTVQVKDIAPGAAPVGVGGPIILTNVGGTLFFKASDGTHGEELWKSDGTSAGTVLVKDINFQTTTGSNAHSFTVVGGALFFAANSPDAGYELWRTDGTSAGTVIVKDILPSALPSSPQYLTNVGGTLFFTANDGTTGNELWKSDGTSAGTVLVKEAYPGASTPPNGAPHALTNVNGTLFFGADDGTHGDELWKSDGTSAGTGLVKDVNPGAGSSIPPPILRQLTNAGGKLLFAANDGTHGIELWQSDGTSAGTTLLKDINPGTLSSSPVQFVTSFAGAAFFVANDGAHGWELWRSDGTSAGTVLFSDINPGTPGSAAYNLTKVGETVFFRANDGTFGGELWKTDGTTGGTVLLKDINPGATSSGPRYLTNVGGTLFFRANDGTHGDELWKSDGTTAGTVLVSDIRLAGSSSPYELTNVGGTLFFLANDGIHGTELWRSDGTSAGTMLVMDIRPGAGSSTPSMLTNFGGNLIFRADDGIHGIEPWILEVPTTSTVTGRHLFYNRSSFDGDNASINTSDDLAIAIDKTAYLPGDGLAVFDNVSSYSRGINGIMIDLAGGGDHAAISLSTLANDFVFKVGNNNTPGSWAAAPTPNAVSVRTNYNGSGVDRVEITWTDGDIKNQWLEVQVLPTTRTGLTAADVFFWGNKIGDIGNPTATSFTTTASGDATPIVTGGLGPAGGITNVRDIDRSNVITAAGDRGAAVSNIGAIVRIDIGTGGPFGPTGGNPANGDAGIASALATSSAPSASTQALPASVANRLDNAEPGRHAASYFERFAESSASAEALYTADRGDDLEELLETLAGELTSR